ncbi:VWA domain-containing protein [Flavobacterium sp. CBA20B-1]|uniref:vWA domain-containing protein n=1 Tax=unclassified Flavobacterium TaxID=196869 RepID=UPI002225031E|nr:MULTISPECIES: VWA domain-containing protein [unclassified Flavobacterium]WCM41344.1 VWA domain-containing protein [Flavobacterium sp. CBA20B-1]
MSNITFLNPHFFWLLLLLLPLGWYWFINRKNEKVPVKISSIQGFKNQKTLLTKLYPLLFVLRAVAFAALIVALARPQTIDKSTKSKITNGVDIVLATDVSGSMLSRDLKPNRLEALKTVAADFIKDRIDDRLGIVVYAAEAYTKAPVTSDKNRLLNQLADIKYDRIIQDGTGIGVGLATAVNRLKESKAKSKVVILMTDGVNNSGLIDPQMAADIAKEYKIKVYTIGIGTNGMAETPVAILPNGDLKYDRVKVEIDEALMKSIAQKTGGKYFRATDTKRLENIYDEINQLEKTKIDEQKFVQRTELFRSLVLLALGLLVIEYLSRKTIFKGFV